MQIILLKDDKKLGKKNTVVKVKDGYGRYLIDQKIALVADKSNLNKLEKDIQAAKEVDEASRKLATSIKNNIEKDTFLIDISYNKESGQLNGAITKNDVLTAIKNRYPMYSFNSSSFINFPKTRLAQLYDAQLCLYKDIVANVKFGVDV